MHVIQYFGVFLSQSTSKSFNAIKFCNIKSKHMRFTETTAIYYLIIKLWCISGFLLIYKNRERRNNSVGFIYARPISD